MPAIRLPAKWYMRPAVAVPSGLRKVGLWGGKCRITPDSEIGRKLLSDGKVSYNSAVALDSALLLLCRFRHGHSLRLQSRLSEHDVHHEADDEAIEHGGLDVRLHLRREREERQETHH